MSTSSPSLAVRGSIADATRTRILEAAQRAFSQAGYSDVGLRAVAAAANCDTTLIRRYFGSKLALFEEAMRDILDISALIDGPRAGFGDRAVAYFARAAPTRAQPVSMLIFATADPSARAVALRLLERHIIAPIAAWLGGSDGPARAAEISMLCSGYFLYRHVLPLAAASGDGADRSDRWLAQALQRAVDD
ncbi:MAG: TetR family transcriptional regulator [Sphingobium sp.]